MNFRIFANEGYYDMRHSEPMQGITEEKQLAYFEGDNCKRVLCANLFALAEFVEANFGASER